MSAFSVLNPAQGGIGLFDLGTQHPMEEGLGLVCNNIVILCPLMEDVRPTGNA